MDVGTTNAFSVRAYGEITHAKRVGYNCNFTFPFKKEQQFLVILPQIHITQILKTLIDLIYRMYSNIGESKHAL